ncbi:MAG: TolB family protein [Phycisphaerae bacterium]
MNHRLHRRIAIIIGLCAGAGLVAGVACPAPAPPTPPFVGGNPFPTNPLPTNTNANAGANDNGDTTGPPAPNKNSNSSTNDNSTTGPPRPNANSNSSGNGNSNSNGNTNNNSGPPAAPMFDDLPNLTIPAGQPYRGEPLPLLAGSAPLNWTLQQGPEGLQIDAAQGYLTWENPVPGPSAYTVLVVVSNSLGTDFAAFQLTVEEVFSPTFERLSVSASGAQANLESEDPSVSDNGNRVAFQSAASNLVPSDMPDDIVPDTNSATDIFVVDRSAGTIRRVNLTSAGVQATVPSLRPKISGDGNFVAFQSFADIFATDDNNSTSDIFVVELATGDIELVSRNSDGDVGTGGSVDAAISGDGRLVAFASIAPNLVANDTNGVADIFVRDREAGTTVRASVHSDGTEADFSSSSPAISRDGRYVVFASIATNLVDNDTNGASDLTAGEDIFVHDLQTSETIRVSVSTGGAQSDGRCQRPAIGGADGELIAFVSAATSLVPLQDFDGFDDVYVHNRLTNETSLVSLNEAGNLSGNGASRNPAISSDGLFIAFDSTATDLTSEADNNDALDVFVHALATGKNRLISQNDDGEIGNDESFSPILTANGLIVVMESKAQNFSASDTNMFADIFLRDLSN